MLNVGSFLKIDGELIVSSNVFRVEKLRKGRRYCTSHCGCIASQPAGQSHLRNPLIHSHTDHCSKDSRRLQQLWQRKPGPQRYFTSFFFTKWIGVVEYCDIRWWMRRWRDYLWNGPYSVNQLCDFLNTAHVWTWITKGLCRLYTQLLCFSDNKWFTTMSIVACRGWKNALLLGLVSNLFSFSNYGDSGFDNKKSLIITQTLLDLMNVIRLKCVFNAYICQLTE